MMGRIAAAVRRRAGEDRGMSLAELLTAMAVFSMVLLVVVGVFTTMTRATRAASSIDVNTRNASVGINELVRQIRSAADTPTATTADVPAFSAASAESMTFTTLVNTASTDPIPQKVQFFLDPTTRALKETVTAVTNRSATYFAFGGTSTTKTLVPAVSSTPTGAPALFVYYDASGNVLAPSASGLTAAQLQVIQTVQITLRVANTNSMINNSFVVSNTVDLPNLASDTTGGTS